MKRFEYGRSVVRKLYKDAICENVGALEKMIQLLRAVNPEMKIYTVIAPRYIETEILDAAGLKQHEDYFQLLIRDMQKKYNFTYLDFKKISDIAFHKHYFFDATHLNYFGALKFTEELKRFLV